MEKFESEIYKNNYEENFPGAVAVLEREEEAEKTERKVTALAEEYLSFNNNETKLEKDLNDMLEKINSLDRTTPSSEFLKGQLCLELYDIYNNNPKENEKYLADVFLNQAQESFLESAKSEDFEIKLKNKDGKDRIFGNKSQALAYLGDVASIDFKKSQYKNESDFKESIRYYKKAISEEKKHEGIKYELKAIMVFRKIVNYLGEPEKLEVWKTPKRNDLNGKTADFLLNYTNNEKEIIEEYIDATIYDRGGEEQKSKERKQSLGLVGVLNIDKKTREKLDFLDLVDFESFKQEFIDKGELSEKNKEIFKKAFDNCQDFIEKIEEIMGDKIKNQEKTDFRKSFYQNPEKILNFSNKANKEELEKNTIWKIKKCSLFLEHFSYFIIVLLFWRKN